MACACCGANCCYPATLNVTVSGFVGGAMIYNTLSNEPPSVFRWETEFSLCPGKPAAGHIIPRTIRTTRDNFESMSLAELNGSWSLQGNCGDWSLTKPALCPYVLYRFAPFISQYSCLPQDGYVAISLVRSTGANNFTLSGSVASGFISANFSTVIACNETIKNIPNTDPAQQQCCDSNNGPGLTIAGSYTAVMEGTFPYAPNFDRYPITIAIQ